MHSQSFIPVFAAGLLVVPSVLGFCGSRLSHFHKRQEGEAIPQPRFGYNETAGPVTWHLLDPEFSTCELVSSFFPIDLWC
jgi:carbonic anhydrase